MYYIYISLLKQCDKCCEKKKYARSRKRAPPTETIAAARAYTKGAQLQKETSHSDSCRRDESTDII